ncbi:hypothetical protein GCK32_001761 [Trichostrongylus colubriformis]|uniref:Uncharacterized protein n=1 Tax=Trichostrongylus colubriformis TaxID=6319 RepID=A0AAN8EVC5_TRICO
MDYTLVALAVSAFSYVIYNALFLAAQLWEAVATLILGLYYVLLFYGHIKGRKSFLIIGTILQAVATIILFGFFVFFFVEIFVAQSLVYKVFTHISHMAEDKRVKVARYASIAMTIDSLITALLHLWALVVCFLECREQYGDRKSDAPFEAMAIRTDLDFLEGSRRSTPHNFYQNGSMESKPKEDWTPRRPSPHSGYRNGNGNGNWMEKEKAMEPVVAQMKQDWVPRRSSPLSLYHQNGNTKANEAIIAYLGQDSFAMPRLRPTAGGAIVGMTQPKAPAEQHQQSMQSLRRY